MNLNEIKKTILPALVISSVGLSACSTVPTQMPPYGGYGGGAGIQNNALARSILSTALNMGTSAMSGNSPALSGGSMASVGNQIISALTAPQYQYAAYRQPVSSYRAQPQYAPPPRYPSYNNGGAYAPQGQYYQGGYPPPYPNQWGY